jgi:cystathionine beta-synthase
MFVVDNVLQAIGRTPLVRLNRFGRHTPATIWGKLEYMNPGGSVKDRPAFQIIADAEAAGLLKPGGTIVEATSGNTGAGLALAAAIKGYKCIFVMPDKMSEEKIRSLRAYGAKVVITPTNVEPEDPRSYYSVSRRIANETPNAFYANQYHNQSNPRAHYLTTGPEIWEQTGGNIDAFVSAAGTGGTISGTGKFLKEQRKDVRIIAADPIGSVYYDYFYTGKMPPAHSYKVEGFGEDFLPSCMHFEFVDEVIRVTDKECFDACRKLVREEGLYTGGSSGGAVIAAVKYAERINKPMNIVVILCDSASRYLSKIFDDEWMRENGFLSEDPLGATISELLAKRPRHAVHSAAPTDTILSVIENLKARSISQVPVLDRGRVVGIVGERDLLSFLISGGDPSSPVQDIMKSDFALVEPTNRISMLTQFFTRDLTVMVVDDGRVLGIITKIDYIDFVSHR